MNSSKSCNPNYAVIDGRSKNSKMCLRRFIKLEAGKKVVKDCTCKRLKLTLLELKIINNLLSNYNYDKFYSRKKDDPWEYVDFL